MRWVSFFAIVTSAVAMALPIIRISAISNRHSRVSDPSQGTILLDLTSLSQPAIPNGLRPVFWPDSNRMGYQDSSGEWKIPPKFVKALPFSEGLAGVCLGDAESSACGFIDTSGHWRIDPLFPRILHGFQEGFAIVSLPGLVESPYGFIDSSGGVRFSQVFPKAKPFHGGESWVQCGPNSPIGRAYAWGILDTAGQWKRPCDLSDPDPQRVSRFP